MKEETKNDILELSKEFDDKEGCVTCEIGIHKDDIDEMETFVKENIDLKLGKWIFMECDTCVGYHGEGFVHASIEKFDTIKKMEPSDNFIKTIS